MEGSELKAGVSQALIAYLNLSLARSESGRLSTEAPPVLI